MAIVRRIDNDYIELLLKAAENHGRASEPDHEVGDLQQVVRACWKGMTAAQRACVAQEMLELLEEWG